jgi:hypothetical protein
LVKKKKKPGMVAYICNPSYSGIWDWEDSGSRLSLNPGKKVIKTPISTISWVWWHEPVIPVTVGNISRKITISDKKWDPISQITRQSKKMMES